MHSNHKLGYANSKTRYYSYYQSLLPHVYEGISNAFWSMSKLFLQMKRNVLIKSTLSASTWTPAFSVHSVSKQIVLSIFSQGVNMQSSRVWSLNAKMLPTCSSWKPSAKALWQVVWSIWMPAALAVWPNKSFKLLSMLITGHYPAGFLMLVYLLKIDSPLVALMPFWSPPYLLKCPNCQLLLICTTPKTTQQRCTQSSQAQCQYEGDTPRWG